VVVVVGVADLARDDDADRDRRVSVGAAQFDLDALHEMLEGLDLGDLDLAELLDAPAIAALIEALRDALGRQFGGGGGFQFFEQSTDRTPTLGVTVEDREGHLIVGEVLSGSVAASAGIEPGDEILSLDGESVGTIQELRAAVERAMAGGAFEVEVRRDGRRVTLDIDPPSSVAGDARSQLRDLAERFSEGFLQRQPTPDRGGRTPERVPGRSAVQPAQPSVPQLGVLATDTAGGVRVTDVQAGSGAAQAGVQPGDLIVAVEGVRTPSVAALREWLSGFAAGDFVRVSVLRDRGVVQFSVALIPPAAAARVAPGSTPGGAARPGSGQLQQPQSPFGGLLSSDAAASAATDALLARLADLVAERLAARAAATPEVAATPAATSTPAAASEPAAELTAFFGRVAAIDGESLRLDGTQGGISLVSTSETLRLGFKDAAIGDLVTVVVSDGVVQMLIVVG
jgi:membrane-associated protease RseP (regulator of RpoE activity)